MTRLVVALSAKQLEGVLDADKVSGRPLNTRFPSTCWSDRDLPDPDRIGHDLPDLGRTYQWGLGHGGGPYGQAAGRCFGRR